MQSKSKQVVSFIIQVTATIRQVAVTSSQVELPFPREIEKISQISPYKAYCNMSVFRFCSNLTECCSLKKCLEALAL